MDMWSRIYSKHIIDVKAYDSRIEEDHYIKRSPHVKLSHLLWTYPLKPNKLSALYSTKIPQPMNSLALILVIFAGIAAQSYASVIESMGVNTVEDARSTLQASDFKLNLRNGASFMDEEEGWRARIFDLKRSPVLGGKDVQLQMADATIQPRGRFLRHFHPRSSELIITTAGRIRVTIEFENGTSAVNTLKTGDVLAIPQGLIHTAVCLNWKRTCTFIATFRTADPGLVALPFRE